jgi:hypothetical protein
MGLPKLSVLLFQREGLWLAVSLEHYLAAQGKTLTEVTLNFLNDLAGQLLLDADAGLAPLEDCPPAPAEFWERYRTSKVHVTLELSELATSLPPVREMLGDVRMVA